MSLIHSSTRRPQALADKDYDHEIQLVDHTQPAPSTSRSTSTSTSRSQSDTQLRKHRSERLRKSIAKKKYSKYQDRRLDAAGSETGEGALAEDEVQADGELPDEGEEARGRTRDPVPPATPQSFIDILYENQRGMFLCGIALFSSRALGNLDPAPWSNIALKTSATDITNAQVPDPSWVWAWKEWSINHCDDVDEDGWEYSFAFSKKFSWHGPTWWNSFVRRRAWTRKRIKKGAERFHVAEGHRLTSDYFTIHPAQSRSKSPRSAREGSLGGRDRQMVPVENYPLEDICDIASLMKALRLARIDREKTEAVENFIRNGGDDLYYLRERMHDIMRTFIFQASRRLLLTHLLSVYDEASKEQNSGDINDEDKATKKKRLETLEAALKHADEEVKRLEYWSDVKNMAEKGLTLGAVDVERGWDTGWVGLDASGPNDVLSKERLAGCKKEEEGNGTLLTSAHAYGINRKGKGKEKATT